MKQLSPRQIHLDFHTSEHIPGIAEKFDPKAFAQMVKAADISSMTVFARCHHGWFYYPSEKFPEMVHPELVNKNLLVEQVRALHEVGVRAPVYITVQWDYHMATTRPDWLIRKADGSHEGSAFHNPGFYQSLCVNTGYYEYLKAHTIEVCELLGNELDGVFFDIVGIRPCWCASCRAEMKKLLIDAADEDAVRGFAKMMIDRFKKDMSETVWSHNKDCTIFYNAGHVGPCTKDSVDSYTHFELESLASGSWGYLHFPVTARYARKLGLDCMGMTGKFHTEWADFHSLKNLAALEFECFRMLSFGFAASIGDQLEPDGRLNPATYRLIGKVYSQFAAREEWARPSRAVSDTAVVTAENPMIEHRMPEALLGAAQMLEELAAQYDIIDPEMSLEGYKLVILPEGLLVDSAFQSKLDAFVAKGGAVIACADGGLSAEGKYPTSFGAAYGGKNQSFPDFLVAKGALAAGLEPENEYVIYQQGVVLNGEGAESLMTARAPYFPRKGDRFCSHRYTPSAKGEEYASVLQKGKVILFAHPIFAQYRDNAPNWCKTLIRNALNLLVPDRLVTHNGPSTLTVSLLEQPEKSRYALHLLSYIPVRKSATIDIIEERTVARNITLTLHLPNAPKSARLVPENLPLTLDGDKLHIPEINGYAVVEIIY